MLPVLSSRLFAAPRSLWLGVLLAVPALFAPFPARNLRADELHLKNGMVLSGTVNEVAGVNASTANRNTALVPKATPYLLVDDVVRRYFVLGRNTANIVPGNQLPSAEVKYTFSQRQGSSSLAFGIVGRVAAEPFDKQFGRRQVTLFTGKGPVTVVQGIKSMGPFATQVVSDSHNWNFAIDTYTLPEETIRRLILSSPDHDPDNPQHRMALVKFLLQAKLYDAALQELPPAKQRFPELADWADSMQAQISEFKAQRGLGEIRLRRIAGQHALAYSIARIFPEEDVSVGTFRGARDIVAEYDEFQSQRELVAVQLDLLQSQLPPERDERLRSLRRTLDRELTFETIARLEPFLRTIEDDSLPPDEKLALAYSGWLLGADHALTSLDETVLLWDARFLVLEYLRGDSDPLRDAELLGGIAATDVLSVQRLAWMVPHLPLSAAGEVSPPGEIREVTVPTGPTEAATRYAISLPPEYSEFHRYPVIIVLRPQGMSFQNAVKIWAGTPEQPGWAQRRGYIVLSPAYCADDAGAYYPNEAAHEIIFRSLDDARRKWRIDSDRVFLTGHGMGAETCIELGMSHPGVFAGCIPVGGACEYFGPWYQSNSPDLNWYFVNGELDHNNISRSANVLNQMMRNGKQDVILCEYKQRGFESYFEEQERIFQWMEPLRRPPLGEVKEFATRSLRNSETQFHWLRGELVPPYEVIAWSDPRHPPPRPRSFTGRITQGVNQAFTIRFNHPGSRTTIRLSPELMDFDPERKLEVHKGGRTLYREVVQPSAVTLLEELRAHGDRERLWWARLEL